MKTVITAIAALTLGGGGFATGTVLADRPAPHESERFDRESLTEGMERVLTESGRHEEQLEGLREYARAYVDSILAVGTTGETTANVALMRAESCIGLLMSFPQISEQRENLDRVVTATRRGRAAYERHLRSISVTPGMDPTERRCQ